MVLASTADGADQQCHAALAGRDPAATGDVSLGQKMLSAVIGSLLTSVLGKMGPIIAIVHG